MKKKSREAVHSEADFQRALEIALNAPDRMTRVQRINSGKAILEGRVFRGTRAGTADLVGFVKGCGLYIEIECKSSAFIPSKNPKGRELAQNQRGEALRGLGCFYMRVIPDGFMSLEEAVKEAVREIEVQIFDHIVKRRRPDFVDAYMFARDAIRGTKS
jgi:hypothetical protein